MKKEIVSIVMSTALLVNNVASPITVIADEVANTNNQALEVTDENLEETDENNVENNESSEGDIESLEIAEEESANEDIEKEDIQENRINTEDIKLLNEETEVVKLEAGKTYEIRNIGSNKISISNNYARRDEVAYDKNGNIVGYDINRDYSNIAIGEGEKVKIKVSTSDLHIHVPMDYKENLEIKEIEGEVLYKVNLEAEKTYEIRNIGANKISISNNYARRDEVAYDKNGNIVGYDINRDYSNIAIGEGEKVKIKVSTSDLHIHVPMDYKENLEIKEIEGEVLYKVSLESGKSYEIRNIGLNKISINSNFARRDEVKYDKNGNIDYYETNKDYSYIDLGEGEKIKITVSTSDLNTYVPMDYKEDLEIKEIEGEVLSKVNLEAGKIYEIINKGQSSIYIKNNYNKREEAKYDKDGNMIYCDKNKEYSNMDLKSGEKIIVKVLNNDLFTYIPMDYKEDVEIIEFTEKQASIKLNVNAINMNSNKTQTLVAKLIDNNPFEPVELEWSSSNSDVASVDNNGKVKTVSVGSAIITVKIKGTDISASCVFVVEDDLNKASVENISAQDYTGKKVEPKVVVKYGDKELQKNIDYTVEYTNNINPGNATVKITGKGNYYGEITKSFVIKEKTNNLSVALNGKDKINLIDNEYETKEFEISSILKNNNLYDMSDISITIELDNGLKLKDGQNKTINIGQLISGDQRTLSWTVQLDNSIYTEYDRNLGYEVIVKESNRDSVIVSKDVFVPGIKSNIDDSNNDNNNNNNNENNNVEVEVFNQLNILTIEQYDSIIEKIEAALQLKDEQGRYLFKLKNEEVQKEILSNGDEIHTYIIQELEYESAMQRALAIVGKVKKEYIIKIRVKKAVIKAIEDRNKGNLSNSSNSNNKPNNKPNSNNTTISSNTNVNKKPSSSLINSTTNKKPSNNSINSTTNKKPNSTSPKTGDAGILGYIGLAGIATSVLSRINRRKKD